MDTSSRYAVQNADMSANTVFIRRWTQLVLQQDQMAWVLIFPKGSDEGSLLP